MDYRRTSNRRDNIVRLLSILSLTLILLALADTAVAAELYGTVYSGGIPAANLSISVEGKSDAVRTDGNGGYRLDVPPGDYTLIIRDRRFPIRVSPGGTKHDIRL